MPLTLKQLNDVCLLRSGTSDRCRYLAQDELDLNKWHCLKQSSRRKDIDEQAAEVIEDLRRKGIPINKSKIGLGDNCRGYKVTRHVDQGYDKKG